MRRPGLTLRSRSGGFVKRSSMRPSHRHLCRARPSGRATQGRAFAEPHSRVRGNECCHSSLPLPAGLGPRDTQSGAGRFQPTCGHGQLSPSGFGRSSGLFAGSSPLRHLGVGLGLPVQPDRWTPTGPHHVLGHGGVARFIGLGSVRQPTTPRGPRRSFLLHVTKAFRNCGLRVVRAARWTPCGDCMPARPSLTSLRRRGRWGSERLTRRAPPSGGARRVRACGA